MLGQVIVPDDPYHTSLEIRQMIAEGCELILVTGGMSVDPDDVTPVGIRNSGAEVVFYGAPVLPGSMFMLGYLGHVAICGLPGCVMYNRTTILDLVLPCIFAGERISRAEIVALGHGGLCQSVRSVGSRPVPWQEYSYITAEGWGLVAVNIGLEEALQEILNKVNVLSTETVPFMEALGRVVAEDIIAIIICPNLPRRPLTALPWPARLVLDNSNFW